MKTFTFTSLILAMGLAHGAAQAQSVESNVTFNQSTAADTQTSASADPTTASSVTLSFANQSNVQANSNANEQVADESAAQSAEATTEVAVTVIGGNHENINEICHINDGYDTGRLCQSTCLPCC